MTTPIALRTRERALLAVLALCCFVLAAGAAEAEAKTQIYTSTGFHTKPSKLYYGGADVGLPGVGYTATGLSWRNWGGGVARTAGTLRVCGNMGACQRFRVRIAASGFVRGAEGTRDNVYSFVSFTRLGRTRPLLKLCVYAEACRLGPVGR